VDIPHSLLWHSNLGLRSLQGHPKIGQFSFSRLLANMENPGEGREHNGYVPDVLTAQPKSYVAHRKDVLIYDNPMVHPVLRARTAKMSGAPVFSMAWVEIAMSKELRHQARSIRPVRSQEKA
jgi:hypothetical protein